MTSMADMTSGWLPDPPGRNYHLFTQFPRKQPDRPTPTLDRLVLAVQRALLRRRSRSLGDFRYFVSRDVFQKLEADLEVRCWRDERTMVGAIVSGRSAWVLRGIFVLPN